MEVLTGWTVHVQEAVILPLPTATLPGLGGPCRDSSQVMHALTQPGGTLLRMELGESREEQEGRDMGTESVTQALPFLSHAVWAMGTP